jgi:hypothetical protein
MSRASCSVVRSFVACGSAALAMFSCGGDAGDAGGALQAATQCAAAQPGGAWTNQPFTAQTGRFRLELVATPSASSLDAVIGLASGSATTFASLAAAVRFNDTGAIDVRDGSAYRADAALAYSAGTAYRVRFDVDLATDRYTVSVRNSFGGFDVVARDYAFRTEQTAVAALDTLAATIDSAAGALTTCELSVVPLDAAGCPQAIAGGGFVHLPINAATGLSAVELVATPTEGNLDAVLGLSRGGAASFADLATAVRFAPTGSIDARDGGAYSAIQPLPYTAGQEVRFRIVADVPTHTYSVLVRTPSYGPIEVGRLFGFRNGQESVGQLDTLDMIVDSAGGAVSLCEYRSDASHDVVYSRQGNHAIAPLANDEVFVTDGGTTTRFNAAGQTLTSIGRGGQQLVADDAGHLYLISAVFGTLTIDAYDGIAPVWQRTYPTTHDAWASGAARDAAGNLVVALSEGNYVRTVRTFASDGTPGWSVDVNANAAALGRDGFAVAPTAGGLQRYDATGALAWTRAFTGSYYIGAMAMAPDGGVVFGGSYFGSVSFGGPTLPPHGGGEYRVDTFAVSLSAAGAHVFTHFVGNSEVHAIATNGARVAVGGVDNVGPRFAHLTTLDATGIVIGGDPWTGLGEISLPGRMAMGASGRLYWNYLARWPWGLPWADWPFLLAIAP